MGRVEGGVGVGIVEVGKLFFVFTDILVCVDIELTCANDIPLSFS